MDEEASQSSGDHALLVLVARTKRQARDKTLYVMLGDHRGDPFLKTPSICFA